MDSKDLAFIAFGSNYKELYSYLQKAPTHGHGQTTIDIVVADADVAVVKHQIKEAGYLFRATKRHQHTYKNGRTALLAVTKANGRTVTHHEVSIYRKPEVDNQRVQKITADIEKHPWHQVPRLIAEVSAVCPAAAQLFSLLTAHGAEYNRESYARLQRDLSITRQGSTPRW